MVMENGVRRELNAEQVTEVFSAYHNVVTKCFVIKCCNISLSKFVALVPSLSQSLSKVPDTVLLFLTCVDSLPKIFPAPFNVQNNKTTNDVNCIIKFSQLL